MMIKEISHILPSEARQLAKRQEQKSIQYIHVVIHLYSHLSLEHIIKDTFKYF